jgi:hypothetical protein
MGPLVHTHVVDVRSTPVPPSFCTKRVGNLACPRFGRDDLCRDAPKIRSCDVRLRTERIEDLPRSGNEGRRASRTERANSIPCVRCHESKAVGKSQRVRDGTIRLGRWFEATHRVHRKRSFEEGGQVGVCELLPDCCWRRVRQRDEPEPCISHGLKTVPGHLDVPEVSACPGECGCGRRPDSVIPRALATMSSAAPPMLAKSEYGPASVATSE